MQAFAQRSQAGSECPYPNLIGRRILVEFAIRGTGFRHPCRNDGGAVAAGSLCEYSKPCGQIDVGQAVPDEFGVQSRQETAAFIPFLDSGFVRHSLTYRKYEYLHSLCVWVRGVMNAAIVCSP